MKNAAASKTKSRSTKKYGHINFVPNASVAKAAGRGLDLRSKFKRGGSSSNVSKARNLVARKNMSPAMVRKMRSYFESHASDKKEGWSKPSDPSNEYISWLLWGGYAGRSWANKIVKQMASADSKSKKKAPKAKKASTRARLASVQARVSILARLEEVLDSAETLNRSANYRGAGPEGLDRTKATITALANAIVARYMKAGHEPKAGSELMKDLYPYITGADVDKLKEQGLDFQRDIRPISRKAVNLAHGFITKTLKQ